MGFIHICDIFSRVFMSICERMFDLLSSIEGKNAASLCKTVGINTSVATNWKQRNTDPPAKYIVPFVNILVFP